MVNFWPHLFVIIFLLMSVESAAHDIDVMKLTRMLKVTMQRNKPVEKTVQEKHQQLEKMLEMKKMEEDVLPPASSLYYLGDSLDLLKECLETNLKGLSQENKEDIKSNIEIARKLLKINLYKKEQEASTLFNALLRLLFYVKPSPNESPKLFPLRMDFLNGLYEIYEPTIVKYQKKPHSPKDMLPLFENAIKNANNYERVVIGWMKQYVNWDPLYLSLKMQNKLKKER